MAGFVGPEIPGVTDGLLFAFDAALSYQSGSTWSSQISPSSYTATLYNTPSFTEGKDFAITFDGADEYAQMDSITYDRNKFSVEVWGKWPVAHPGWVGTLFCKWAIGTSNSNEWVIGAQGASGPSLLEFGVTNGSVNVSATSSFNYSVDTWYHLVGTFDSGSHKLYVNGEEEYSGTTSFTEVKTNTTKFTFASITTNVLNYTCNCEIGSARLYSSKALSSTEVLQNYNALKSRFNL